MRAPSPNPASSPRKVGQPSADRARMGGMTSGALPSTRPRVWDTSGATPSAARVALECALESVWTVPTDARQTKGGLDQISAIKYRRTTPPRLRLARFGRRPTRPWRQPSRATSYPLSYLSWQGMAKSSARSEQMASWFTEWVCHADVMQALAGCRAFLGEDDERGTISLFWHR